jgi:hypothetical protein
VIKNVDFSAATDPPIGSAIESVTIVIFRRISLRNRGPGYRGAVNVNKVKAVLILSIGNTRIRRGRALFKFVFEGLDLILISVILLSKVS